VLQRVSSVMLLDLCFVMWIVDFYFVSEKPGCLQARFMKMNILSILGFYLGRFAWLHALGIGLLGEAFFSVNASVTSCSKPLWGSPQSIPLWTDLD